MMQAIVPLAPRTIKGKEQYVVAGGKHKTVIVYDVEGRVRPEALSQKFDALSEKFDQFRIFRRVCHLQSVPTGLKGCSMLDQLLNCSNSDNRVPIVGWGGFGGRKEVTQRRHQR